MGEKVLLPDGRVITLPVDISPEERNVLLREIRSRYKIEGDYVPERSRRGAYTDIAASPPAPRGPEAPGLPGLPQGVVSPYQAPRRQPNAPIPEPLSTEPPQAPIGQREEVDRYAGQRTLGGQVGTLFRSIPIGFQQAYYMAKAGALGWLSPDEDTQAEKDTRRALEELILKVDPAYRESHMTELGMALGTMGGIAAPALIPGIGTPLAFGAAGLMGSGEQAERMARHEEETGEDISKAKELLGLTLGLGIGFTEMIPAGKLIKKGKRILTGGRRGMAKSVDEIAEEMLDKKLKRSGLQNVALSAGRQALEEAVQESAAGFAQSATAYALYDDYALVGSSAAAFKEALLGGEVGAIADLALSLAEKAVGGKARRRYERLRAVSKRIREAHKKGIEEGTIDDGMLSILEVNKEGGFVDQSTSAKEIREDLRLTPEGIESGNWTSQMNADAAKLYQQVTAQIKQGLADGTIEAEDGDAQLKQAEAEFARLRLQMVLAGGRLAEIETGTDPTKLTQEEFDALEKKKLEEAKVETAVEETKGAQKEIDAKEAEADEALGPVVEEEKDAEALEEEAAEKEAEVKKVAEKVLQAEEDVDIDAILDKAPEEEWTEEDVETIEQVSTIELSPAPEFQTGELGNIVFDELVPNTPYFEDKTKARIEADLGRTAFVLSGQEEMLDDLVTVRNILLGNIESSDATKGAEDRVTAMMAGIEGELKYDNPATYKKQIAKVERKIAEYQKQKLELDNNLAFKLLDEESTLVWDEKSEEARAIQEEVDLTQDKLAELDENIAEAEESLDGKEGLRAVVPSQESYEAKQDSFGGRTRNARKMALVERQAPVLTAVIQQIKEGGARRQPILTGVDARGEEVVLGEDLLLGYDEASQEKHIEDVVERELEDLFGENSARDLNTLVERLPYESQRRALRALQSEIEADPTAVLNPQQVRDRVQRIFAGGIYDESDIAIEYDIKVRYDPNREETVVTRVREDPEAIKGQVKGERDPEFERVAEYEITAVGPELETYNRGKKKKDKLDIGSIISQSVYDKLLDISAGRKATPISHTLLLDVREAQAGVDEAKTTLRKADAQRGEQYAGNKARKRQLLTDARANLAKARRVYNAQRSKAAAFSVKPITEVISTEEAGLIKDLKEASDRLIKANENVVPTTEESASEREQRISDVTTKRNLLNAELRPLRKDYRAMVAAMRAPRPEDAGPDALVFWKDSNNKEQSATVSELEGLIAELQVEITGEEGELGNTTYGRLNEENQVELDTAERAVEVADVALSRRRQSEVVARVKEALAVPSSNAVTEEVRRTVPGAVSLTVRKEARVVRILERPDTRDLSDVRTMKHEMENIIEPKQGEYDVENVKYIMRQLLATKSSNEVTLPDDASLEEIATAWDNQKGKPPKDALFHAQAEGGIWNYDFLKKILPPNADGTLLSNAEIDGWLPQVRVAEPEDGPRFSENRVLLQGHDLFMALHGGPIRRGRSHGRNLIHVEYSPKRPAIEMPEGAERVLTEMYDSPTIVSLGLWLDTNAVDRPTVKDNPKALLPKTASQRLRFIRQRLLDKKDVTLGMVEDALIDRGLAKVENGRLVVESGFIDKVISTTLGVEKSFGDLTLSERFMVLERVLRTNKQVIHTNRQKSIREDTGLERSQRRLILERIRDAGNDGLNLNPNSNQMKELLADLGLIEETTLDVVSEEDALEMTEEDLIEARDREKDKEDRGAVVVFGEEGAKAYERAQRISNTTRPELIDSPAQKEADDLIERMESGLSPEQERILFGIGEKGLNAEELTSLAREAGIYQLSQISQDSDQEIIDSFKFLAGGERAINDLGVQYGLRRIAAEAQNRGISGQVLIEATLERMLQRGVDPANASEYLSDRLATWMQMGAPVGRKQLAKPAIQPTAKKEAVRLVKNFVETVEVVERVGKTQKVKIARPESRPKVVVTDEQVENAQVKEEAQKVVEEGTNEETRQAEEEGGKQWRDEKNPDKPASVEARTAEAVRAQQRIKALKRSLRERAIRLLGRKKGSAIAIEIEASFDSIYENYVKAVANRNQPAYLDTYTGVLVFNISQLEQQYADDPKYRDLTKVPIEMLARNAMLHEGAHVLFLNNVLTPQEKRNLRLYGERQRVPEEVSKDAVNPTDKTRMTWRQWIESQPGNDRLNDAELMEEMQVQILDALASGTIPGSKAAGAIGIIKQRMMQRIKILLGIQKEGGLSSILSVFDKLQDQVEVARRMEVAEEHGLADLRFAERADPNDLKDIVEAMKAGDEAKVKELATMIAHKRTKGIEIISPTQQFMNEMRARSELEDTPKGIISVLNGGAIVDGTISPAALNEYFKIQDGQAPYMMDKPRRELLGRRRPRALTDDDESLVKRAEERDKEQGIGDTSSRDASEIISINKVADGEILDATPEDIRKVWEYSAKMRYRKAYLDKRLPQALSSERAAARKKAWGIQSMIDSITAWRYADNSQSFLPALWERGPIEKTKTKTKNPDGTVTETITGGYVIVQNRDVHLQEEKVITPGGVEIILNKKEVITTSGLSKLFERVIDKLTLKVTRQYGEAARVIGTRGRLDEQRREFVRRMAEAGVRIDIDTGEGVRLGGLKLTKQGTPILKKTPKVKGKPKVPDMAVLVRIKKPENLTPQQEAIWNEYADPRQGKIGVWQRRYDRVNYPGTYKKKNQDQRTSINWSLSSSSLK